jgi:hypothetical protein
MKARKGMDLTILFCTTNNSLICYLLYAGASEVGPIYLSRYWSMIPVSRLTQVLGANACIKNLYIMDNESFLNAQKGCTEMINGVKKLCGA